MVVLIVLIGKNPLGVALVMIDRELLERVILGYRNNAERIALSFSDSVIGSLDISSSIDYLLSTWRRRLSYDHDPAMDRIPNIEDLRDDVSDMMVRILKSRYKPSGTESEIREKRLNYLNNPDLLSGLEGSFNELWKSIKFNFLKKFKNKLNRDYAPHRYTLEQRSGGRGKWEVVDSYLGSPKNKESLAVSKKKFMNRMLERSEDSEHELISDTFKNNFDSTYRISVTREDLFAEDYLLLNSSEVP